MIVKFLILFSDEYYVFVCVQVQDGCFFLVSVVVQYGLDLLCQKVEDEWFECVVLWVLFEECKYGVFVFVDDMQCCVVVMVVV